MKKVLSSLLAIMIIFTIVTCVPESFGIDPLAVNADASEISAAAATKKLYKVGIRGSYYAGDAVAALKRMNAIRYEACKQGVKNPADPEKKLTLSDYKPLKWSAVLEKLARIRATEAILARGHKRPNGKGCFSLNSKKIKNNYEILAWNYSKSLVKGVNKFYEEKYAWVHNTGGKTGHYEAIINPNCTYVGIGGFYSKDCGYYDASVCARFTKGNYKKVDQTKGKSTGTKVVSIDVTGAYIKNVKIRNLTSPTHNYKVGKKYKLEMISTGSSGSDNLIFTKNVKWSSSNKSVATISAKGVVTIKKRGSAKITAKCSGITASYKINIIKTSTPQISSLTCNENGVTVKWKAVSKASAYRVYRKNSEGKWVRLTDTKGTSATDVDVTYNKKTTYMIRSLDVNGNPISDYKKAGWSVVYKVDTPQITSLVSDENGATIRWNKIDGVSTYRLYYKKDGNWKRHGNDIKGTSKLDTGVGFNIPRTYTVAAMNKKGEVISAYNTTGWTITYKVDPPEITSLESVESGVKITWNKVSGVSTYRVFYKANGGSWQYFSEDVTGDTMIDTNVADGDFMKYSVRAISKKGRSISEFDNIGQSITYYKPDDN